MTGVRTISRDWAPKEPERDSRVDQSFGWFLTLGNKEMWRSYWSNGNTELRIFGRGERPNEELTRIWTFILPQLDKLLVTAVRSLPPPPRRSGITTLFFKPKEVSVDLRFIMLDLVDDGSYELRFDTDLVVDEGEVGAIVTMKDDHVLLAEWSI